MPTNNWMRDDRLGGLQQLAGAGENDVFGGLYARGMLDAAVAEKANGTAAAEAMAADAAALLELELSDGGGAVAFVREVVAAARYGVVLARIVEHGWRVMALGYAGDRGGGRDVTAMRAAIDAYDAAWAAAAALRAASPYAASPYHDSYRPDASHPEGVPGLGASVDRYRGW